MDNCLFCKIINGDIPSKKLYEDDKVLVFLDINPSTNGDCLLVPKKHVVTIEDLDDELVLHMFKIAKQMKKILEEKLNIEGLTLVQNNGYGQDIKHYHIHLTPRYTNDLIMHNFNKEIIKDLDEVLNLINE